MVLRDMGKAEIVNEYDFSLPGQGKQRGRSTTFGKWTLKGNDVVVTYAKMHGPVALQSTRDAAERGRA